MKKIVSLLILLMLILVGCQAQAATTPEEIIHNLVSDSNNFQSYYGVSRLTENYGDLTIETIMEEKVAGPDLRYVESTDVTTGYKAYSMYKDEILTFYSEELEEAFQTEGELPSLDPSNQLDFIIDFLSTFTEEEVELEVVGEEEIVGRMTDQLQIKNLGTNSLFDEMVLWVDQEMNMILKFYSKTGEMVSTTEYEELQLDPSFDEDDFFIPIPEHMVIEDLEEGFKPESITLDEAKEFLGKDFLLLSEELVTLSDIEISQFEELVDISFIYSKDSIAYISLFVNPIDNEEKEEEFDYFPGAEQIIFRDTKAYVIPELNWVMWEEGDFSYTLMSDNPTIEIEELLEFENQFISY
ncbi:hypothetical protein BTS2_0039 [Bacillus sp. TS-2]|nr:hypothetical protein BTS2_0039 [Bacillus sp. TS-2]